MYAKLILILKADPHVETMAQQNNPASEAELSLLYFVKCCSSSMPTFSVPSEKTNSSISLENTSQLVVSASAESDDEGNSGDDDRISKTTQLVALASELLGNLRSPIS